MYYPDYNPSLHDIFLYGPGNSGYPIAINSNSLIAGASADFASVMPRIRRFQTEIKPLPLGATEEVYPNYYNADTPLHVVISEKIIASNIHYTANKPSDSTLNYAKYTGTTTAYPTLTSSFWKPDLSGFTSYGPFSGYYNCLPSSLLPSGYSFANSVHFSGSPEIPGFATGATQYLICNPDLSFSNLLNSNQNIAAEPIKIISPHELITDQQLENINNYLITEYLENTFTYAYSFPVENVYYWDGNDKCIPVEYLKFSFNYSTNFDPNYVFPENLFFSPFLNGYFKAFSLLGVGDSSGQLIYLQNNKLYFLGAGYLAQANVDYVKGANLNNLFFPLESIGTPGYQQLVYTNLQALTNLPIDRDHYSTTLNTGLTLATQIDFTRVQEKMNLLVPTLNALIQRINN